MNRPNALWACLAAAGLAWGLSGCGKGAAKDEAKAETEATSAEESSPVAEAPAPPPPPAAPPKEKSGTDELLSLAGGDKPATPAPGSVAPAPAPASPPPAAAPPAQGSPKPSSSADFAKGNSGGSPPPSGGSPAPSGGSPTPGNGGNQNPYGSGYSNGGNGSAAFAGGGKASGDPRPSGGGGNSSPAPGGGAGAGADSTADFNTPIKAAETFLAALKSKDVTRIAEAVAKHAEHEASPAHQVLMTHLLNADAPPADVDDLAASFEGMKVEGLSTQKSTGKVGVVVGKTEDRQYTNRTLYMRKEKEGWKVQDYSGLRQNANTKKKGSRKG